MSNVSSGAPVSSAVLSAGETQTVLSGGVAVSTTILSGGSAFVLSGGVESLTQIDSAGAEYVSGGTVYSATANNSGALFVSSGDAFATIVNSGGVEFLSGGDAFGTTVNGGGAEVLATGEAEGTTLNGSGQMVVSGGAAYSTTVNSGAAVFVSGGAVTDTLVNSGAAIFVSAGAAYSTTIDDGGSAYISGGALYDTTVNSGGADVVSGGTAYDTVLNSGGNEFVLSGGSAESATVDGGGQVLSGGNAYNTTVIDGGTVVVSAGTAFATEIDPLGEMIVQAGGVASAPVIGAAATLVLSAGASVDGDIEFHGLTGLLEIGGTVMPSASIAGFGATDTIDLTDIAPGSTPAVSFDSATDVLAVSAGGNVYTLDFAGDYVGATFVASGDGGSGTDIAVSGISAVPCFAAGTRIATPDGEVPVERLAVGDLVRGPWGEAMPVRWLGFRHVDCARHPRPETVWPVRVRAGALRPGVPAGDLFLSPDHAIFLAPPGLRPVLIPVGCLIDGASIAQERVAEIHYWHVELERHAVLLAEGLPCESFLDVGNRAAFANGGPAMQLHPAFAAAAWASRACAPQVRGGPVVEWARALLAERRRDAPYLGETGIATSLRRSGGRVQGGS